MANSTISGLANSLTGAVLAVGDLMEWTDVSDTSMGAGGTSKKMTAAELVKGLLGNSAILTQSLTGSAADSLINATATWNTSGTPTLIKAVVTDTASNGSSLFIDLLVGASSKFKVAKNGDITLAGSTVIQESSGAAWRLGNGGTGTGLSLASGLSVNFSNANVSVPDLHVLRDAANTLAQRNGTNAQESRIYGTYTDSSNYRRLAIAMTTAGVASIAPAGAGTGASGNVLHISGLPTSNPGPGILWNNAGTPAIGT